jgi:DNA-binding NtrC family response regulator
VTLTRILVVDDEGSIRRSVRSFLEAHNYEVLEAASDALAGEALKGAGPDSAVILDCRPTGSHALEVLPRLRRIEPAVPIIVFTASESMELAVSALRAGADQILTRPVDLPTLLLVLERLLECHRNRRRQLASRISEAEGRVEPFLGASTKIHRLAEAARRLLTTDAPILIEGETGTGKGALARWLHDHSPRADEPFVEFNCAGRPRKFVETALFGHERRPSSGSRVGLLEIADRGTVLLDELADVDRLVQPKLLTLLDVKRVRRLGDTRNRRVDVRLIAATSHSLLALVQQGTFRSDLHARISTMRLELPPLRERVEDIPLLAGHLLRVRGEELGRRGLELSPDAEAALCAYSWPGNIRELRNVLERAAVLSIRSTLRAADLHFDNQPGPQPDTGPVPTLKELERRHIEQVLKMHGGHVAEAAISLGVPRSTLYQRMKQHGLRVL